MPHELDFVDGQAAMMYVQDLPWHNLGTRLEAPPTAEVAIRAAHLDWEVGLKAVYCMERGLYYEITDRKAVVRLDRWGQHDFKPFGLVFNDYQVLQNTQAFAFFDSLIESGQATYETAGALGHGERVWVLAKVKEDIFVKGKDRIQRYLLLSNGHDGKTALDIRFTPIRVVCKNTLMLSMQEGKTIGKVYHVRGMRKQIEAMKTVVEHILDRYDHIAADYEKLANTVIDMSKLGMYLLKVFPDPQRARYTTEVSYEAAREKVSVTRNAAGDLFTEGKGNDMPEVRGTLWAAYNGVAEYVDHHTDREDPWKRMRYTCFGEGCAIKERAFTEALKMTTAN